MIVNYHLLAYQQASIKKLIAVGHIISNIMHVFGLSLTLQFLNEKNYPKSFTPKALQTPTSREFLHIFNVS